MRKTVIVSLFLMSLGMASNAFAAEQLPSKAQWRSMSCPQAVQRIEKWLADGSPKVRAMNPDDRATAAIKYINLMLAPFPGYGYDPCGPKADKGVRP